MTFSYNTEPRDMAALHSRSFLRNDASKKLRIRNTVISGVTTLVLCLLIIDFDYPAMAISVILCASVGTSLYTYLSFESGVKRRTLKYCQNDLKGERPLATYTLSGNCLRFESRGAAVEFYASNLVNIQKLGDSIEIDFGKAGLCLIPIRAFPDANFEAQFIQKLKQDKL